MKYYIAIEHEDRQDIVQHANSVEHAKQLIKSVMPPLRSGYKYIIITQ